MSDGMAGHPAPLVRDGGVQFTPAGDRDPFVAWIDLMEAVEALCPSWPVRALRPDDAPLRL
jgi:hypothetical protein